MIERLSKEFNTEAEAEVVISVAHALACACHVGFSRRVILTLSL